jgi:hypothetical protein
MVLAVLGARYHVALLIRFSIGRGQTVFALPGACFAFTPPPKAATGNTAGCNSGLCRTGAGPVAGGGSARGERAMARDPRLRSSVIADFVVSGPSHGEFPERV